METQDVGARVEQRGDLGLGRDVDVQGHAAQHATPPGDDASSARGDATSPAAPSDSPSVPVRLLGRLTLVLLLDALALLALSEILSGFTLSGPLAALGLAAVLGVANAVVWPLIVRFALPFTVLTLGLGALILNAALLLGAAWLLDDVQLDGLFEAVVVTLGLTLITTLVGGVLALDRGDLWYRHVVVRQAKRAQLAEQTDVPGVVFLEIDGLAHDVLRRALRDGNAPVLARWMHDRGYRLERMGDRLVLADRRLPGRAAARLRRRHARVPLVGEGHRPRDRHQPPARRGRDRAPPLQRARAALRRRRQPREHPLRRRAAQHADDEHGARPQPPGPARAGLLRLLRQPVRRRPHAAARDRRVLHRALLGGPAGPPRRPPADQARLEVRARALLRDRHPARPAGRVGHRRRARRAPGDLHDVPGLRRGRAPLGDRTPRHARGPAQGRPGDRPDRRRGRARAAAVRARRALRPRPEPGRDVPPALRRGSGGHRRPLRR